MKSLLAMLAVVVIALSGCGAPDDETARPTPATHAPRPPSSLPDLPVGTGDVAPGDDVRGDGTVLEVGTRRIDLAPLRIDEVAVVVGGVFFRNGKELWFTDLDRARATDYLDVLSVVASPDGRRVALIDRQHGPKDGSGTPLAMSAAFDAATGRLLVASYAGMGDLGAGHLAQHYRQAEPRIVSFEGADLVVHGPTGDYRVPLDGTAPRKVAAPAS